jgi:hypothetical protein
MGQQIIKLYRSGPASSPANLAKTPTHPLTTYTCRLFVSEIEVLARLPPLLQEREN